MKTAYRQQDPRRRDWGFIALVVGLSAVLVGMAYAGVRAAAYYSRPKEIRDLLARAQAAEDNAWKDGRGVVALDLSWPGVGYGDDLTPRQQELLLAEACFLQQNAGWDFTPPHYSSAWTHLLLSKTNPDVERGLAVIQAALRTPCPTPVYDN